MALEDTDVGATATIAEANAFVVGLMLEEIVDALRARNLLKEQDIAAALLRTEHRAALADKFGKVEGRIFNIHFESAQLATESWQSRHGLEPMLYALRKRQDDWLAAGEVGESPLKAEPIVTDYPDDED